MDPSGGWFGRTLIAVIVLIIAAWMFAPHNWAIGITIGLFIAFIIFIVYILSSADMSH